MQTYDKRERGKQKEHRVPLHSRQGLIDDGRPLSSGSKAAGDVKSIEVKIHAKTSKEKQRGRASGQRQEPNFHQSIIKVLRKRPASSKGKPTAYKKGQFSGRSRGMQ